MQFIALYIQVRRDDGQALDPDDVESLTTFCKILSNVLETKNVYGDPFDFEVEHMAAERMVLVELGAYPLEGMKTDQIEQLHEQVEARDLPQAEAIRERLADHMGLGYEVRVLMGEE